MTPTPPSPEDDILDLLGLDLEPEKPKAQTPESDFEKELEALFAEDLTEPEIKSPAPDASAASGAGDDALLLEDLAPAPGAPAVEDVLDLGDFSAPASSPAQDDEVLDLGAFAEPGVPQDDEVLDLGVFSTGGELDITPPEDTPGGKDGGIDTAALDDLISGLGETRKPQAPASEAPLDETDMSDLLETLNVPSAVASPASAAPAAPLSQPADEMLELSLDDLVEGMPAMAAQAEAAPEAQGAETPDLDISLPDLSDPEPLDLATQDMGGDLDLPLAEAGLGSSAPDAAAEQLLDTSDLDISGMMEGGMMEGLGAPAEDAAVEQSLDPAALLDQISDGPDVSEAAPGAESASGLLDGLSLGDAALGVAAAGAAVAGGLALGARSAAQDPPSAEPLAPEARSGLGPMPAAALQELQEKLAALATQVTGGSVALVRLEGQLAEKDQALAALEQRLHVSWDESHSLRRELSDLRSQLEETLRQRAQADEKAAMEIKERLALVEDRQIQIDRDVRTEIERAVPREAARVIREEIAALASSMHDE
ncbi:MAG: hypothetical protein KKA55_07520 [Proteobacteria bacterium]|nr:hypothetical protein [Pseudomonadota bacterium]MBU1595369.1 hypothetical protein [Pseudomonadota bacterium]